MFLRGDRRHFCVLYEEPRARRVNRDPQKINASASRRDELSASFMGTMSNSRVIFTDVETRFSPEKSGTTMEVRTTRNVFQYYNCVHRDYSFLIEKLVSVGGG